MNTTTFAKKKLVLGKVDYSKSGRKNCKAVLAWELENGNFSMQGEIWNPEETDIYCGGQCVDEVASYFPHNKKVQRMVQIWKRYHLNDMRPACEHQRLLGWGEKKVKGPRGYDEWEGHLYEHEGGILCKPCPECGYKYGSSWLKEEIPPTIIAEIESW